MKQNLLLLLITLAPFLCLSQTKDTTSVSRFGLSVVTSFNGELYALQVAPSLSYSCGKNQFQIGVGVNPFDRVDQTLLSGELSHKYFPNGTKNKFNLYLITRLSLVHNKRNTYYPANYNYLFLYGGYGFQIRLFEGAYMGTNMSLGTFTFNKNSDNPYEGFTSKALLDKIGVCLSTQFHLSYRF